MSLPAILLGSSLPAVPSTAENLQYQITGLLVVLSTLGSMALLVWLAGKLFAVRDRREAADELARRVEPAAALEIPGPVLAAIAAAVGAVLQDRRHIIHGIQAVDPRANMAWGAEGRRSIYATHKLR
jgi:heme/copper-type cytochrome/quinol oxidase subunit 2